MFGKRQPWRVAAGYNHAMAELEQHLSEALVRNLPLTISVELGRSERSLDDTLSLGAGDVVDLTALSAEPVNIYADGMLYAVGQLTVVDGCWAVKLGEVLVKTKPDFLVSLADLPEQDLELEDADIS